MEADRRSQRGGPSLNTSTQCRCLRRCYSGRDSGSDRVCHSRRDGGRESWGDSRQLVRQWACQGVTSVVTGQRRRLGQWQGEFDWSKLFRGGVSESWGPVFSYMFIRLVGGGFAIAVGCWQAAVQLGCRFSNRGQAGKGVDSRQVV